MMTTRQPTPSPSDVLVATFIVTGVELIDFSGPYRSERLCNVRAAYAWVAHETFGHSYPQIHKAAHKPGHSTLREARMRAWRIRNSAEGGDFIALCHAIEDKAAQIARQPMNPAIDGAPEAVARLVAIVNAANPNGCTGTPAAVDELAQAVREKTYRARPAVDRVMGRNRGHA